MRLCVPISIFPEGKVLAIQRDRKNPSKQACFGKAPSA
jgi:hypothetical protein